MLKKRFQRKNSHTNNIWSLSIHCDSYFKQICTENRGDSKNIFSTHYIERSRQWTMDINGLMLQNVPKFDECRMQDIELGSWHLVDIMSIVPTVPISISIFYENGVVNQFFGNIQKAKPLCELKIDLLRRLDIEI